MVASVKHALAFSSLAVATGCALPAPVSEDVSSRDIDITFRVENAGAGAVATADLETPFEGLRLTGGDKLVVRTEAGQTDLAEAKDAEGGVVFQSSLGDVSGPITLDLVRSRDESSLGHTVLLPPPFALSAEPLSLSSPISFTWDGFDEGYEISAALEGDCIVPLQHTLMRDLGAYAFPWSEVQTKPDTALGCPLTITVRRFVSPENTAMFDTEPSGWFNGASEQRRSVTLPVSP